MKLTIMSKDNVAGGQIDVPLQFTEPIRSDLIKRAVHTAQANARQAYGASPEAGKRHTTDLSKRRRKYRGCYGFGISRTPRKIMSRSGTRFGWVGALAPNTVGGRRAHPAKFWKIWDKKLNVKERRKAIRSALAATLSVEVVAERGHKIPKAYPFVIDTSVEQLQKSKEVLAVFEKFGFTADLARCEARTRAGKGKMRGRRKVVAKSVLLVVANDCPIIKAARNIPGVDVCIVSNLNTELLAPGAHPGRASLFSKDALLRMQEEELFLNVPPRKQEKKTTKEEDTKKPSKKRIFAKQRAKTSAKKKPVVKAAAPKKEVKPTEEKKAIVKKVAPKKEAKSEAKE